MRPKRRGSSARWPGLLLAVAAVASGCATTPRDLPRTAPRGSEPAASRDGLESPPGDAASNRLIAAAEALVGTPYRFAGTDPSGFDCSGLTSFLFDREGVTLPRTAAGQAEEGRRVALDELGPGDLVFFAESNRKPHHVGLVVSRPGEALTMIHASSSSGVVETDVTTSEYWLRRLRFGRRMAQSR